MSQKNELILINISGSDRPGVTASLTEILAKNNAVILDIGQADIHNNLSLGILFQSPAGNSGDIMKELLFKSYELDVNIRFNPITEAEYNEWVNMQGKNRYIITILSRKLTAKQIAGISQIVSEQGMNIDDIKRLTGRIPLDENKRSPKASVEFSVRGTPKDKNQMQKAFLELSSEVEMDISFQEESMYRRMRRLICFDMDSTLIQTEVIDELAIRAGVGDEVKAITEAAMRGEIDFSESFRQRCQLLKGLDVSVNHIVVYKGDNQYTFPGGMAASPLAWNYTGKEYFTAQVVAPESPVRLFTASKEQAAMESYSIPESWGIKRELVEDDPAAPVMLRFTFESKEEHPRFFLRMRVREKVENRPERVANATCICLQTGTLPPEVQIGFLTTDGYTYTAPVNSTGEAVVKVPLSELTQTATAFLPHAYPSFLGSYFYPETAIPFDTKEIEQLEIFFPGIAGAGYTIEAGNIWLE